MTATGRILVVAQPGPSADALCQRLARLGHSIAGMVDTTADAAEIAPRLLPDLVVIGVLADERRTADLQIAALRERLDCPCLTVREGSGHASLPVSEQLLQTQLELGLHQKRLERERSRAEAAEHTSRTTARAIHEINNLLSAIRCNAFLIQSENIPASAVEASNDIAAAVERSATLIQDLAALLREQRLSVGPAARAGTTSTFPRSQLGSWPPAIDDEDTRARNRYIVLVVDDDPVVRRAVARFVASAGYQVIESSTPEQGLAAAERYPVDLMITDLVMPNMTGYELAQRVGSIRPNVRIIYMSGFAPDEFAADRARTSGPDPIFLQKPFAVDALMPSVFAMLAEDKSRGPSFGNLTSNKQ